MHGEPVRIGKRGTVVIPAPLRRAYGLTEGSLVVAEPAEGGILLRPAAVLPVESIKGALRPYSLRSGLFLSPIPSFAVRSPCPPRTDLYYWPPFKPRRRTLSPAT